MNKNYAFNYFLCFHIIISIISIIISIILKNNFTKERGMYEHEWTYFIYDYLCRYVYTRLFFTEILLHTRSNKFPVFFQY